MGTEERSPARSSASPREASPLPELDAREGRLPVPLLGREAVAVSLPVEGRVVLRSGAVEAVGVLSVEVVVLLRDAVLEATASVPSMTQPSCLP